MKGILIRVGIDMGTGGTLGPIFDDGTFEFIPFPDHVATGKNELAMIYSNIFGTHGVTLDKYLPAKFHSYVPHSDPEFLTPSYGDPTTKKQILRKLNKGDSIFFQAGLKPQSTTRFPRRANYIIAYFRVNRTVDFSLMDTTSEIYSQEWEALQDNYHVRVRQESDTFVVMGKTIYLQTIWSKIP